MKLNRNSTNAVMYRWFYQKDKMPQSLCPYFWKLVIAWIFGPLLAIITLPAIILYGDFYKSEEEDNPRTEQSTRVLGSIIIYGTIFLAICMLFSISLFWYSFPNKSFFYQIQVGGAIAWIMTIVVGLTFGTRYLYLSIKERRKVKTVTKDPNIVSEFIKAKYNKYCPKIDWE